MRTRRMRMRRRCLLPNFLKGCSLTSVTDESAMSACQEFEHRRWTQVGSSMALAFFQYYVGLIQALFPVIAYRVYPMNCHAHRVVIHLSIPWKHLYPSCHMIMR